MMQFDVLFFPKAYGDDLKVFVLFEKGGMTLLLALMEAFGASARVISEQSKTDSTKRCEEILPVTGKIMMETRESRWLE